MTREEKLQKAHRMFDNRNLLTELKWQREYFKSGYVNSQEELFNLWIFDECIKVLEQEPTTKNDLGVDAVRRKAVLNTLDNMDSALDNEDRTVETYKKLLKECYKVLPSVTPQEPILEKDGTLIVTTEHYKNVGRVLVQYGTNGTLFYQDQEPKTGHWIDEFGGCECSECGCLEGGYSDYCPNCGADMREVEE